MTRLLPASPVLARPRRFLASLPHGLPTAMTFALSLGVATVSSALVLHATLLGPPRRPALELATGGMGAPGWSVWHASSADDASPRPDSTPATWTTAFHPSARAGQASASAGTGSTASGSAGAGSDKGHGGVGAIGNPGTDPTATPRALPASPDSAAGASSTPVPAGDDEVLAPMPSPSPEHEDVPQPEPTPGPVHERTPWQATPSPTGGAPGGSRTPEPSETPEPTQTPEPGDR